MANREALRELQTRLASRLKAAQSAGASVTWLAVRTGQRNYLFPLSQSGEIVPLAQVQTVPYVRPWFRGVLNIRGGLYGVVDFATFVTNGVPAASGRESTEASVVTLNSALEVNCALQVDSLLGLRGPDAFVASEPTPPDAPPYFSQQWVDAAGAQWQEIDLRALAHAPQFLNILA